MSYQYVRATGKAIGSGQGEMPIDITGVALSSVINNYTMLNIVYFDTYYNKNFSLVIDSYRQLFSTLSMDITGWLNSMEGIALDYSETLPGSQLGYVKAGDVQLYNYRLSPGNHLGSTDSQALASVDSAADIRMTHVSDKKDWADFSKKSLYTVNGHFCRALGLSDALYLIGGCKNYRVNPSLKVNCLDFTDVSTLNTYQFNETQIRFVDTNGYRGLFLDFAMDLTNKDVWLVIGGRPYFGDPIVKRIGPNTVKLDVWNTDFIYRLFESLKYIDLSDVIDEDRKIILNEDAISFDLIKGLLLNSNSFLVAFDKPAIGVTVTPLETYTYPSVMMANDTFQHPLLLDNGLFPAYRTLYQNNRILMNIDIRLSTDYANADTGISNGGNLYHAYTDRYMPHHLVKGYSFKIHTLKT